MDPPLPSDFDPYGSGNEPMQQPRKTDNEGKQDQGAPQDEGGDEEILLPLLHMLPRPLTRPLKRFLLTGSCCAGVALLYVLEVYDHGMMPGVDSSFARASEVQTLKGMTQELYVLSIARAIRDLSADNCAAHSVAITEQIDLLQSKYKAISGAEYPHVECKNL